MNRHVAIDQAGEKTGEAVGKNGRRVERGRR